MTGCGADGRDGVAACLAAGMGREIAPALGRLSAGGSMVQADIALMGGWTPVR